MLIKSSLIILIQEICVELLFCFSYLLQVIFRVQRSLDS